MRWSFLATLAATAVLAGAYMLGPMRAYAYLPLVFVSNLPWWQDAALGLALALAIGALVAGARSPASHDGWSGAARRSAWRASSARRPSTRSTSGSRAAS